MKFDATKVGYLENIIAVLLKIRKKIINIHQIAKILL
jgi:hypothetical protein